jgi:hypothetical protein
MYIQKPDPVRPHAIVWMDQESRFIITFEAVHPEASDSVLLEHFRKALNDPRVGAARRPACLRVAEDRWAELLRSALGEEFEIRVGPTPEILEAIRRFVDDVNPSGVTPSYLDHRLSPDTVGRLFRAAAELYRTSPWKVVGDENYLFVLDAPRFNLVGASISIIGSLGEHHGILVYESLASYEAFSRQAEQFSQSQPRRSELRTPALSVTFNHPMRLPPEMVREVGQYGWELAGPSAYPLMMAFDPDNVARPISERDCELAAACCLAVGRLVARLPTGSRLDPPPARETLTVETLADHPTVTVALPLLDISHLRGPYGSSPPS